MKESARMSPFAAKTRQQQQEQWIWWQCQQGATSPVPESSLPPKASAEPAVSPAQPAEEAGTANTSMQRRNTYHGQYDAVINRMRTAMRQTGQYTSCSSSPERQKQPSSGSENAEA